MPNPSDYKTEDDFVSACIAQRQDEHPDEDDKQSAAVCYSMWSEKSGKLLNVRELQARVAAWMAKQDVGEGDEIEPNDGESKGEFMMRCAAANNDVTTCSEIWNDFLEDKAEPPNTGALQASMKMKKDNVIRKTHAGEVQGMEFVLSDETVDRYGDVINASGWELSDFKKNPIALFNHNSDFPIGKWENLHVKGGELRGHLKMAPEGTSARIDELRKLIDAGILKAVSVGFHPITQEPLTKGAPGNRYVKSSLVETSLVSVPANPNALAIARSLKVSDDTLKIVFGEQADKKTTVTRGVSTNGKHAETKTKIRNRQMSSPIAQRIVETQDRIVKLQDELNTHLESIDDAAPTDDQTTVTEELSSRIDGQKRSLSALKNAETRLAVATVDADPQPKTGAQAMAIDSRRPFAMPIKKVKPVDYIWRALTVQIKHHAEQGRRTMNDVLAETYGEADEGTRTMMNVITRGATAPATTTTSGWAQDLVTVAIGEFFDLLQPVSVYAALTALGGRFDFGQSGILSIPTRSSSPTLGGAFVAQGSPIPVKQGAFTAITLTPKKVGVISTMTREISIHSTPAIEALVRDAIVNDTANAIDSVLLDATAASAIRPAGLRYGLSTQGSPSGSTTVLDVIADLKNLMNSLFSATNGNVRTPVWITTPSVKNAIAMATQTTGAMPFRDEVAGGTLMGYPIISSTNAGTGYLYLMDAADFISVTGDTPRFDVSDQAVLHFDDTTPLDITTSAVGTTVKSLWQTDSLGIRMLLDCNWAMRRTGMIYFFANTLNWD